MIYSATLLSTLHSAWYCIVLLSTRNLPPHYFTGHHESWLEDGRKTRSTSRSLPTLVPLTNLKILCRKKEVLLSLWVGWNGRRRRNPSNRFLCVESVWVIKQSLSWIKIHRLKPQEFTSTPTAGSSLEEGESPKDSLSPLRGWRFSSPNLWTCNFAECQNHQKFCWRLYLQP